MRTPTRLEDDARLGRGGPARRLPPPFGDPARPTLFVLSRQRSLRLRESLTSEGGYRVQPPPRRLASTLAGFYSRYEDLLTAELAPDRSCPALGRARPSTACSRSSSTTSSSGYSYGGEVAAWWQVIDAVATPGVVRLSRHSALAAQRTARITSSEAQEDSSPRHQVFLRN